jgi:hypothetical protein
LDYNAHCKVYEDYWFYETYRSAAKLYANSAVLLMDVMSNMQSVSGPKEVLEAFEVPQELDLPKGEEILLCPDCYRDMFEWHAQIFRGLKATKPLHSFFGE